MMVIMLQKQSRKKCNAYYRGNVRIKTQSLKFFERMDGWMFWVSFITFIVFLVLQLCKVIAWSWWWVTAPLWGGFILYLIYYVVSYLAFSRQFKSLFGEKTSDIFAEAWKNRK